MSASRWRSLNEQHGSSGTLELREMRGQRRGNGLRRCLYLLQGRFDSAHAVEAFLNG